MGLRIDADRLPGTGTSPEALDASGGLPARLGASATAARSPDPDRPDPRPSDPVARELDELRTLLDSAVVSVESYSTEGDWLAARRSGIGASEAAAVLGLSRYQTRVSVWLDKVGAGEPVVELDRMKWGKRLQRVIANGYVEDTGRELVDPGPYLLLRSVRYPFLVASPDYLVRARAIRPDPGLLEIKSASAYSRAEWREEPPLPYLVQVQSQMLVSGLAWAALAALIGGQELVYTDVAPHDGARAWLLDELAEFWELVQSETPPRPLDGSEATTKAIRRLYGTATSGKVLRLAPDAYAWDEIIVTGEAEIKRLTAAVDAAKNELRAAMGDAESAELSDGASWTNKVETRKGYTRVVEPWSGRVLRRRAPRGDDGKG